MTPDRLVLIFTEQRWNFTTLDDARDSTERLELSLVNTRERIASPCR